MNDVKSGSQKNTQCMCTRLLHLYLEYLLHYIRLRIKCKYCINTGLGNVKMFKGTHIRNICMLELKGLRTVLYKWGYYKLLLETSIVQAGAEPA